MAKQVWAEKKKNRLATLQMDVPQRDENAPVAMLGLADDDTGHNVRDVLIPLTDTMPEVCRS
jgi:hypothetical protein